MTAISQLSPTVKGFTLQVSNSDIDFSPGQWCVKWCEYVPLGKGG